NEDYNGVDQNGVGYFQQTTHNGLRWSTAKGYLKPVRNRTNLTVKVRAQVTQILFEGLKAIGIEYQKDGQLHQAHSSQEVILSAGAIGSPQILQNSGVGPKELLEKVKVPLVKDLQGVGANLQDHLQIRLVFKTSESTLNDELNNFLKRMWVGLQFVFNRSGPLTLAASQVAIFTRSNPEVERPDIQFHMQPLSADKPGDGVHPFSAFTCSVCQLRPWSKGKIEIKSNNPLEYPAIYANYLSDERDQKVAIDCIKVARKISEAPSLKSCIIDEYVPGRQFQTDEELLQAARDFSQTIYHPSCTCAMGSDPMSVVDDRLRVHGIQALRIVDASIMPELVSGNTNAPCIMIAEKAADMIKEDAF
ncbi:MAG: choline dehydrogenase, partial [Planctomycetota bacterium]